ncbi:MAG TPA: hypothetical protein DEO88_18425, partial [Syntrophobacteraceae bacterium]|nr:hypothetical protein [Syntrophobacteraceae bacterium]
MPICVSTSTVAPEANQKTVDVNTVDTQTKGDLEPVQRSNQDLVLGFKTPEDCVKFRDILTDVNYT